jgi:hypothetical protein
LSIRDSLHVARAALVPEREGFKDV